MLETAQKVIDEQAVEIHHLRKQLFGRRSEKISRDQLSLFAQTLAAIAARASSDDEGNREPEPEPKKPNRKNKTSRRTLKPTRTEEIPVPEDERPCPECGQARCTLGHVRSIVVEYTPPKLEVIEYLREKIVCRPCEGEISIAPPPAERVIDRALPGPQLLSVLVTNKAVDGLPLQRTRKILKRAGLDIPVRTLNRWEGYARDLLEPIIKLVRRHVLDADIINLDDTGLRVRDPTVKGDTVKGHVWAFVGRKYDPGGDLSKTREFVFYDYAETWEAVHPENFLKDSRAVLQGDAYRGYERIASGERGDRIERLLAGCCMHARRPFVQALDTGDPAATFFVERFQRLYKIEERAKRENLLADVRLELRQTESMPIMEELYERARELSSLPLLKPMRTGTTYFMNQWEKLKVPFTTDGRLEIDNGVAERYLRRVASGRKAWLFAGSHDGARRFADVLSLVSTADAAGVDAGSYLPSVLGVVSTWPNSRIEELLPRQWRIALEEMLRQQTHEE
ncbi:MAG: IS66 family transposase [Deltaproteobacteria bacterium]